MEFLNKSVIGFALIVILIVIAAGVWLTAQKPVNNTTKFCPAINITSNNTTNQSNNTTATISADRAKQIAQQYVAMGVVLGDPYQTTYKNLTVWAIPVYTSGQMEYVETIYIDIITGNRVQ